ncbi:hypothetical protein PMAYCL1PPCAC_05303, partial [Pristionchus mayeri]
IIIIIIIITLGMGCCEQDSSCCWCDCYCDHIVVYRLLQFELHHLVCWSFLHCSKCVSIHQQESERTK